MPYRSAVTGQLADLMRERGDIAARRAQQSGQTWANVAQAIGSIPAQMRERRMQEEDRAAQQQVFQSRLETDALQRRSIGAQMDDRANAQMDEQATRDLAQTTFKVNEWLAGVAGIPDKDAQQQAYTAGREALIAEGRLEPSDAPEMFPGVSWVKSRMAMLLPATERFKQLFPEPEQPQIAAPGSAIVVGGEITGQVPFKPDAPSNPTEASLAAAAAAGDTNAAKALRLLRQQNSPAGPRTPVWVVKDGKYVDLAGVAPPGSQPANVREQSRPVTGAERKTLGFFQRMLEAERNARAVEDAVGGQDFAAEYLPGEWLENMARTPEGQRYIQAQRTFTEARLRKESGAAIPQGEYDTDRSTNFKRPNDKPESVEQKRAARLRLLRSAANEAGRALEEYYGPGATVDSILSEFSPPEARSGVMVNMRAPDGSVKPVPAEQVEHYKRLGATVVGQ